MDILSTLKELRWIEQEISRLEADKERIQQQRLGISFPHLSFVPSGGEKNPNSLSDQYMDLERLLDEQIDTLYDKKQQVYKAIQKIPEAKYRVILGYYYLDGLTAEQVAEKMGYESRQFYRTLQEAKKILKEVSKCQ